MKDGESLYDSEVEYLAYDGKFKYRSSEPKDEEGTSAGPNPMEFSIMSLPVCEQETSQITAENMKMSDCWKDGEWKVGFDVNLNGYFLKTNDKIASKDIFQKVHISALVKGNGDKKPSAEQVAELQKKVASFCPISRLFDVAA